MCSYTHAHNVINGLPFCFEVCIFQHNTAVIPPNMVILTMYSAVREYTTPVKTSCETDVSKVTEGSGVVHCTQIIYYLILYYMKVYMVSSLSLHASRCVALESCNNYLKISQTVCCSCTSTVTCMNVEVHVVKLYRCESTSYIYGCMQHTPTHTTHTHTPTHTQLTHMHVAHS